MVLIHFPLRVGYYYVINIVQFCSLEVETTSGLCISISGCWCIVPPRLVSPYFMSFLWNATHLNKKKIKKVAVEEGMLHIKQVASFNIESKL